MCILFVWLADQIPTKQGQLKVVQIGGQPAPINGVQSNQISARKMLFDLLLDTGPALRRRRQIDAQDRERHGVLLFHPKQRVLIAGVCRSLNAPGREQKTVGYTGDSAKFETNDASLDYKSVVEGSLFVFDFTPVPV